MLFCISWQEIHFSYAAKLLNNPKKVKNKTLKMRPKKLQNY